MKRASVVVVVLVLLLLAAPGVWAKSTLTLNPLGFLVGPYSLEYETEVGGGPLTLGVPLYAWSVKETDLTFQGSAFGVGLRYYFDGTPHEGFYVGAYASWANLRGTSSGTDLRAGAFGFTGVTGYKWSVGSDYVVDLAVGVGSATSVKASSGGVAKSKVGGPYGTSFSLGVGVSF